MIGRYGEDAALEAVARADVMLDKGDMDGRRVWLDILEKIEELQWEGPAEGEPTH